MRSLDPSVEARLPNTRATGDAAKYLNEQGSFSVPAGGGGGLTETQAKALIADWAETGNDDIIPTAKLPESASRVFGINLLEDSAHGLPLPNTGSDHRGNAIVLAGAPDLDVETHGVLYVEASFSVAAGTAVGGFQLADQRDDALVHLSEVAAQPVFQADRNINGVAASTVEVQNAAGNRVGEFSVYIGRDSASNEVLAFVAFEADGGSAGVRGTVSANISIQYASTDTSALVASRIRELASLPDSGEVGQVVFVGSRFYELRQIGSATVATEFEFTVTRGDSPDGADEDTGYSEDPAYGSITDEYPGLTRAFIWEDTLQQVIWRFRSLTDPGTFSQFRYNNINEDNDWSDIPTDAWAQGANQYTYGAAQSQVTVTASPTLRVRGQLAAGRFLTWWAPIEIRGERGPQGEQGQKGDKGDKGDQGDAGVVSNATIDARIADWAETGNNDPIPAGKLTNAPSGGGGLNQAAVDARVKAGVLDWAETANTERVPEGKLPEKLDELMDSFNLVGWQNEGNTQNDSVWVGPGRRSAYTSANIAGLAYAQSVDFSPGQVGWHIPIQVPDDRVDEVAAGTLRLQLDDEEFVQSDETGASRWMRVHSGGGYTYYQCLIANVPVGTQLVQHNIELALTEERVKAIARTVGGPFPTRTETAVSEVDYYLASDPTQAPSAQNPPLGNGFLLPGTWTTLWTHTEAAKALLHHKFDISVWCAWNPSGGGDRGFVEWRLVRRTAAGVETVEERDNLYIRNMPASGTPIQDANGISRYRYIRLSEDLLYEAGDTFRLEVKGGSQRGTADNASRGSSNYIQFAGDARDSEARNSVITYTKNRG